MRLPKGYREQVYAAQRARSVEAVWHHVEPEAGRALILPDGRCDVIVRFNPERGDAPRLVITGPATEPYWTCFEAGDRWSGVRMRPERGVVLWGHALMGAANELRVGAEAEALVPALRGISALPADDATISAHLVRFVEGLPLHPNGHRVGRCVAWVHLSGGRLSVQAMAARAGCSPRHLNRMFRGAVGVSLKTYAGLVRFHRALRLVCDAGLSLSTAAFEAGYADHAHMTREMRRFGGFVPSDIPRDLIRPDVAGAA